MEYQQKFQVNHSSAFSTSFQFLGPCRHGDVGVMFKRNCLLQLSGSTELLGIQIRLSCAQLNSHLPQFLRSLSRCAKFICDGMPHSPQSSSCHRNQSKCKGFWFRLRLAAALVCALVWNVPGHISYLWRALFTLPQERGVDPVSWPVVDFLTFKARGLMVLTSSPAHGLVWQCTCLPCPGPSIWFPQLQLQWFLTPCIKGTSPTALAHISSSMHLHST